MLPKTGCTTTFPMNRHSPAGIERPFRATTGCEQSQQTRSYSITSSARATSVGGTVRPSALAVLRLTCSSNLVGCCTGRAATLAPLRMRSTYDCTMKQIGRIDTVRYQAAALHEHAEVKYRRQAMTSRKCDDQITMSKCDKVY